MIQVTPSTVVQYVKSVSLENYDVTSLENMASASTPIQADLINAVKERFPNLINVYQMYGMTEMSTICSELDLPKGPKPGSVGKICPGFVIKIVDINTREPLGPNQRGEICIKAVKITPGYIGVEEFKAKYMDEEGFFKTGDVGYYDEDRYFFLVDRLKELIKFNDTTVAPAELESILLKHAAVRDAGVVGAPHPQHGQVPTAFVVLQPAATVTADELLTHVKNQLAHRMRLAGGVRFMDALPHGAGEKLDRKALRLML